MFLNPAAGQQAVDVGLLAVADFERNETAGDEGRDRGWNEAAIDVETVFTGEEGHFGFVIADFDGEGRAIGDGDVWGIGNDEFELLANDRRKQIALQEANAISETHAYGIVARHCQRGLGNVDCRDCCAWAIRAREQSQLLRSPCLRRRCVASKQWS